MLSANFVFIIVRKFIFVNTFKTNIFNYFHKIVKYTKIREGKILLVLSKNAENIESFKKYLQAKQTQQQMKYVDWTNNK